MVRLTLWSLSHEIIGRKLKKKKEYLMNLMINEKKKLNINLHLWVLHYICYIWYLKKLYNLQLKMYLQFI